MPSPFQKIVDNVDNFDMFELMKDNFDNPSAAVEMGFHPTAPVSAESQQY